MKLFSKLIAAHLSVYSTIRTSPLRKLERKIVKPLSGRVRKWGYLFSEVQNVVHVGANSGQERLFYDYYDLNVLWIEPNPWIFPQLVRNLRKFKNQEALNCLITDKENESYTLFITNNEGQSSSILPLNLHKELWPEVQVVNQVNLKSRTLNQILTDTNLQELTNLLVLDTQGSELLVLQGSLDVIQKFKYILVECADFESYSGGANSLEISNFLSDLGFFEIDSEIFAQSDYGNYRNVLFANGRVNLD